MPSGRHIVEGRLRSGELLPIEADLAREFGTPCQKTQGAAPLRAAR